MKKMYFVSVALFCALGAQAQFGIGNSIQRSVERGVRRGVENAAEKQAEEIAEREINKAFDEAEKQQAEAEKQLAEAEKNQAEAEAEVANIPSTIPTVANTPYTPTASEVGFFPIKKGSVQTMATKDDKGKITAQTRNTITGITGSKGAFAVAYTSEFLDEKGKPVKTNAGEAMTLHYSTVVKDGFIYIDMKNAFGAMDGLDDFEISGTAQKLPNTMNVGQTIDDANMKVKIAFMTCVSTMTDGKVVAQESVTTPAGTFQCYKVAQKVKTTALGMKVDGITNTWYAKGVGTVKTESYDSKGKFISAQELIAIN